MFIEISRLVFDQTIVYYCLAKFTHKINHYKQYGEFPHIPQPASPLTCQHLTLLWYIHHNDT